ncbi:hypothetical protein SPSYN_00538 [Sporotomaculum syntrophicum]|uniref:UPF0251 protein SPSYN_00538 n=1 Tax=Sporotomaculum syntrophicum TaxID=182264 RepID=A0A9D2WQX8_9FIRM|nr:DUF134 domain-containing protein [Sporotomaculum syntrophicum]KAF1085809.1 hypothetical protein SPSYN_00538 [Sporotomaculum syntrophicum]
MSRPPKCRRVEFMPETTFFKPAGVPVSELEVVRLTVEELEAIRLKDLLGLEQEVCAEKMGVSRPTYHRILSSARGKVATALLEGKAIRVAGGHFEIVVRYFKCLNCGHEWELPCGMGPRGCDITCPHCQSSDVSRVSKEGIPMKAAR